MNTFSHCSKIRYVALLAAAVVVAGCSSSGGGGGGDEATGPVSSEVAVPSISAVATESSVKGLALPIEAYMPTAAMQNIVIDAETKVTQECMARFGFTWSAPSSNLPNLRQIDRLFGVTEPEDAARYGYHLPSRLGDGAKPVGGAQEYSRSAMVVLTGDPSGEGNPSTNPGSFRGQKIPLNGCYGEGRMKVTGVDQIEETPVAFNLLAEMSERAEADARVRAGFARWSECMGRAGYTASDPISLHEDSRWSGSGTPSRIEIRTATADVGCKREVNLIGTWYAVESAYERAAIQRRHAALTESLGRWRRAAEKAAGILGVPAPAVP